MPYIANPLEGIPLVNTFITDQSLLGTTPATDDVLIIYDQSATALKQLTIAELQASVLASPAFTGVPTAPTAGGGTNTTQVATTAFVTTATTALNTITEMTDVTITSIGASEVLKWSGSAWINQTLAEANILPAAGPTFTGVLTVGSAVISEADLEQIDDLTAGTAVASKALVVDANKDIGTIRNLTIDGTFSDGNYTFDTSGNVSGLGTIGSGNITSTGTVQGTTITATTAFVPDASDGAALGTTALEFSDLFLADGAVISLGDDDDVTLTHVVDTGILLSSTDRFQFGDAGTFIHQSADGILTIESDTTVDINGAVVFGGALTGITTIASGTHTIGTLVLAAASITDSSGTINFGDENITTTGTTTTGNLTVTGTTTTVNTATLAVEDPLIILASGNAGGDTVDIGFYGLHDTTGSQDIYAGLFRDASDSGKWKLFGSLEVAPDTTVNVSGAGYAVGTLVANLEGNATGTAATVTTAAQPAITSVGTLSALAVTGAVVQGTLTTGSGSITDSSGAITFVNENLSTTGTLAAGTTTIGTLVVAAASITDTSGSLSFGDENLSTTGTLDAGAITGTGLDINGAADISGVLTMSGGTLDMSGEDIDNIRSATFIAEVANGATGGTMTIDWGAGQKQSVVLSDNTAFTFTAPDGPCNLMLKVTHAANTTTYTPTWAGGSTNVDWPAATAPTFTQTSGSVDIVAFYYDGTNANGTYFGQASLAFA
jgi:hypothetical protein